MTNEQAYQLFREHCAILDAELTTDPLMTDTPIQLLVERMGDAGQEALVQWGTVSLAEVIQEYEMLALATILQTIDENVTIE
jgi:hypothetical protein